MLLTLLIFQTYFKGRNFKQTPKISEEDLASSVTTSNVTVKQLSINNGKNRIKSLVFTPKRISGKYPGLLLIPPGFKGATDKVKERAARWAENNFIVLVPDLPQSEGEADFGKAESEDVAALLPVLAGFHSVDKENLFAIGFGIGANCLHFALPRLDTLKGAVLVSPIPDLTRLLQNSEVRGLIEKYNKKVLDKVQLRALSPLYIPRSKGKETAEPKLLLIFGEDDEFSGKSVPVEFLKMLKGAGSDVEFQSIPDRGHLLLQDEKTFISAISFVRQEVR